MSHHNHQQRHEQHDVALTASVEHDSRVLEQRVRDLTIAACSGGHSHAG